MKRTVVPLPFATYGPGAGDAINSAASEPAGFILDVADLFTR